MVVNRNVDVGLFHHFLQQGKILKRRLRHNGADSHFLGEIKNIPHAFFIIVKCDHPVIDELNSRLLQSFFNLLNKLFIEIVIELDFGMLRT